MRYIDEILNVVRDHPSISKVHKQVLINRIVKEPTTEEIKKAKDDLEEGARITDRMNNRGRDGSN